MTPLYIACLHGHLEVVRQLLALGAAVDAVTADAVLRESQNATFNDGSTTPLLAASDRGHAEIARLLMAHGAAMNHANAVGGTAVSRAEGEDREEVAALLRADFSEG